MPPESSPGHLFPTTITDDKGKQRKKYRYDDMMTPYEKFHSLARPGQYLKPGITVRNLDVFANEMADNKTPEQLNSIQHEITYSSHCMSGSR